MEEEKEKSEASEKLKKRSQEIAEQLRAGKKAVVEKETPKEKPKKKSVSEERGTAEKQEKKAVAPKKKKEQRDITIYSFADGIRKAREYAPERGFKQTWDLAINLKGLDLKKPENRLNLEFSLPAGRGKSVKVGVIVDALATEAKNWGADLIIRKDEINALAQDKKKLKKIANAIDWFFGEVTLMALIGRSFGTVLGPRGKIPKPLPPKADVGSLLNRARSLVRVVVKDSPVIHVPVGVEEMKEEDVIRNIEGVYGFVKEKIPKGINNIKNMYLKLTMGRPVKLEVK